ncbi:MAG: 2-oxo acid dehydrogenase subunit E2 [Sphingobacteriaceae bacterium]|nr:2-oxo acid dehydrogenase subunit E2 [Sphingobacteriaceae bacterium]
MAEYQLTLPKMGESVAEATLIKWVKKVGDSIQADEIILEIATDKVDSEVPSPVAGKLIKVLFNENDVVQVGEVIALIEIEGGISSSAVPLVAPDPEVLPEVETPSIADIPGIKNLAPEPKVAIEADFSKTDKFYSPLVKSIAAEERITPAELDEVRGTGADGKVTKQDLLDYIANKGAGATKVEAPKFVSAESPKTTTPPVQIVSGSDEIIEMDRMRKLIAEHMVMSKQTSPHVTSFVEADVTNVVRWRDRVKSTFEKRENEKLTFTPIFIEAVAKAIKDFPMINVSVNGQQIIVKKDINIGMATALPSGNLIVPVIKRADQLNMVGLSKSVNDLANRARNNKLQPDEVKEGTFTLTNLGSFGNIMGTPIINQPQVAILAVGAIKKKPAVLETDDGDVIAIRHMMFLSLSYDHRVVDGGLGGSFVRRVADYLEAWDVNREA